MPMKYRAKITVGHLDDGRPIVKYASGNTKKELAANTAELRKRYVNGPQAIDRSVLFGTYCVNWFERVRKPSIPTPAGRAKIASALNAHILPAFADRQLRAVTLSELSAFMQKFEGKSSTLIGDIHSALRGVFATATAERVIDVDPTLALKRPKSTKTQRRELTQEETSAALSLMHGADRQLAAFTACLLYTGARLGEILALKWEDIDFGKMRISITCDMDYVTEAEGHLKTPSSVRVIPLMEPLADVLRPMRSLISDYVFNSSHGNPIFSKSTKDRLVYRLRVALLRAEPSIESVEVVYPGGQKKEVGSLITPHYFRHNFASILFDAGVDVMTAQKYLGHASPQTTMQIYTHLMAQRQTESELAAREAFRQISKGATFVQPSKNFSVISNGASYSKNP